MPESTKAKVDLFLNSLGNSKAINTAIIPVIKAKTLTNVLLRLRRIAITAPKQQPALTPKTSGETSLLLNVF